ncbi:hypothetical protein CDD83_5306 [Cordyceps sp. RAO-2017]|nr:hypothetical protein CDD83_5306 [Cordyceps sp. RAO-2017]
METRRSARRRRQRAATEMLQAGEERQDKSAKEKAADAGDTDEEVMSQLVTESFAASQQSESQESPLAGRGRAARRVAKQSPAKTKRSPAKQSPEKTKRSPAKQGSIKLSDATAGSPAEATPREGQADGEDDTLTIAGTLRTGLEQLRKAALTRDKVYELEDMLMDMKRELYEAEKRGRKGKQRKK